LSEQCCWKLTSVRVGLQACRRSWGEWFVAWHRDCLRNRRFTGNFDQPTSLLLSLVECANEKLAPSSRRSATRCFDADAVVGLDRELRSGVKFGGLIVAQEKI